MNRYRCETCKHRFTPDYWKDGCNRFGKTFMSDDEMRFISTYGCASHSDFKSERDTVWVVAESRFEWYEIRYICSSKEVALQRWVELRDELINGFQEMVEYCIKEDYHDADDWRKRIDTLKNLKPGESCDCDYPDLKEWGVELRQAGEQ